MDWSSLLAWDRSVWAQSLELFKPDGLELVRSALELIKCAGRILINFAVQELSRLAEQELWSALVLVRPTRTESF